MYDFINYNHQSLPLADVLAEIDKVLSTVPLSREAHLAYHMALQQVIAKLKPEADKKAS